MSATTPSANPQSLDQALQSGLPVLVKFWAPWCGPCKALAPVVEEIAHEQQGKFSLVEINIDDNIELAQQYGVQAVPTMLLFKGGEIIERLMGNQPKAAILKVLEPHLI